MILSPVASRAFVGRDAELAALAERRRKLAQRHGSVVLIGGPAGIGKSRLLAEFCATIDGGRAPLLVRSECAEFGGITFGPVRDIIDVLAAGARDERFDHIARRSIERTIFFAELEGVVRDAAGKRAIVACIEDIHWADPATLEFLIALASRVATERVMVVATYRDEEVMTSPKLRESFGRLFRAPSVHRLRLEPLFDNDVFALLESAAEGRPQIDRTVRTAIARRAEGNPFHAEELLKSALESDASPVPLSISGTILRRFEALTERDRAVLNVAAIVGYRFDPALLVELTQLDAESIAASLRNARNANLVVEDAAGSAELRFRHALVHEAIAAQMLEYEARRLHARVAHLLEGRMRPAEIAYHWWRARDRARGARSNEEAGDEAFGLHAYRESAIFFERALEQSDAATDRERLILRLASALSSAGEHREAAAVLERGVEELVAVGNYDLASAYACAVAGRLFYAGDDAAARATLDRFLLRYGSRLEARFAENLNGWRIWLDPGCAAAASWFERNRDTIEIEADSDAQRVRRWIGIVAAASVGDRTRWQTLAHAIVAHAPDDARLENLGLGAIAETGLLAGFEDARAHIAAFSSNCRERSLLGPIGKARVLEAYDTYLRGDLASAAPAIRAARATGDPAVDGSLLAIAPFAGYDLDDLELANSGDDPALDRKLAGDAPSHSAGLRALGLAARYLARGRPDRARTYAERGALALASMFGAAFALPFAARYAESPEARAHIERLCAAAPAQTLMQASALLARAALAVGSRSPGLAALAREAAEGFRSGDYPLLEAQARELCGEFERARELYVRCGAARHVRRFTLSSPAAGPVALTASEPASSLSPRENDVATAVAQGLGNSEIAARLGLSVKTVESHLSRIYARLGFRSRAQLAAFVATRDMNESQGSTG